MTGCAATWAAAMTGIARSAGTDKLTVTFILRAATHADAN